MTQFVNSMTVEGLATLNGLAFDSTSTATTLNGTLTLTLASDYLQYLTGTATGFSVALPNATTLPVGFKIEISNTSSQSVAIKDGSGTALFTLSQSSIGYLTLQTNATAAGGWVSWQVLTNSTASGILNYNLISTTTFTTASASYVAITGFTLTPQAGTYAIWYSGQALMVATPKAHNWAVFRAGTMITDSERSQDTAHSNQNMNDSTQSVIQFDGTQACDVRVFSTSGNLSILGRSLLLIRLGP